LAAFVRERDHATRQAGCRQHACTGTSETGIAIGDAAWTAFDELRRCECCLRVQHHHLAHPMLHAPADISLILAIPDDVSFLSALASHPEVEPFLAVSSGNEEFLRGLINDVTQDPGPHGLFVIRAPGGEPVGSLALSVVNRRSRICELSRLMIRPEKRRTGIASAAVRLACRKVLVDYSFHRIQLEVYGDNLAAQALFERVGFVREGTRRSAYWRRERWLDGVQFGLLADEFTPDPT
jgi:RimJ/RimL family protein N-acetyltransferase